MNDVTLPLLPLLPLSPPADCEATAATRAVPPTARGVVAVIPARGGSKSIPRKNVWPFAGHPLIAWSIAAARAAQHAGVVDRVVVSTDDEEIREVARSYGADAPFLRPSLLAQDDTRDLPVFAHALEWLAREEGYAPDVVVQLRPTSPLRAHGLVAQAVARLRADPSADSLRALALASQNPYKMWRPGEGAHRGYLAPLLACACGEPYDTPRQQLPPTYWQTGQIDVVRRATILDAESMTGARILPLVVDPALAVDLDTPDQWAAAEWLAERHRASITVPNGPDDAEGDGAADDTSVGGDRFGAPAAALGTVPRPTFDAPRSSPPAALGRCRLVVLDFDGVLTDNRVYVDAHGCETVACDRGDGLGLAALRASGMPVVVLSTEPHPVVAARCAKLGLPSRQGLADKARALADVAREHGVPLEDVIYVGNDVNDDGCLRLAGLPVVPADAHPAVRRLARWTLTRAGGRGAVRELCDALLSIRRSSPATSRAERSA